MIKKLMRMICKAWLKHLTKDQRDTRTSFAGKRLLAKQEKWFDFKKIGEI